MIDSFFRSPYQKWVVSPLLEKKFFLAFSPHFFTFLAALTGLLIPFLLLGQCTYLAFIFLILSGFFDTIDGSLARKRSQASPTGAAFDILSDRFVEFCIVLGLLLIDPAARALPALFVLGSIFLCVTSFLIVGVFEKNDSEKSFHYSAGLIERAEAFIFFGLMILLPSFFTPLAFLFSGLVFFTAVARIYHFSKTHN